MDLEHTKLGAFCEAVGCNQRDFLPFNCDICHKKLCLAHRTHTSHGCSGPADMTSLSCPICGESVRFPQSEDPDVIWNNHYLTTCNQKPATPKPVLRCACKSCRATLGLSNCIDCSRCKLKVCLSHRAPEDHQCQGVRSLVLSKVSGTDATQIPRPPLPNKSNKAGSAPPKAVKTLTQPAPSASALPQAAPIVFECPLCGYKTPNSALLQRHLNLAHPELNDQAGVIPHTIPSGPEPSLSSDQGNEVCLR